MKTLTKTTVLTLIIGMMTSFNTMADVSSRGVEGAYDLVSTFGFASSACQQAEYIDVQGASDFDSNGDGAVTILEVALANPLGNLGQLVNAVLASDAENPGLVIGALGDPSASFTVFAPVDSAFAAIPEDVFNGIVSAGGVTTVLLYHVMVGHTDPRFGTYLQAVDTLLGQDVWLKRGRSEPRINNSNIECTGVLTDNGLVWLLDSVLLPQF